MVSTVAATPPARNGGWRSVGAGLHGWAVKISNLAWLPPVPVKTLGDLRKATDAKLRRDSHVGKGLLAELGRYCPADTPTVPLQSYREANADARAALRMIREVVEQHAPPGSCTERKSC